MHINNVWHSFQKKDFCSFSFGSDGTDFSRLATLRAKHKHAGWGLPVWPPSTQHVQVNVGEQGGTSDAELLALALLSQETHYHYYKLQDKPRLRQSIKWAWSWGKKRNSSHLMSVEDNRVADEDNTCLPETNSNTHMQCHSVMCRLRPIIGMSSDLQCSLRLHRPCITSGMCTRICACLCGILRGLKRNKMQWLARIDPLCSAPSIQSNNICQVNNKPDGSFVSVVTGNENSMEQSNLTKTWFIKIAVYLKSGKMSRINNLINLATILVLKWKVPCAKMFSIRQLKSFTFVTIL